MRNYLRECVLVCLCDCVLVCLCACKHTGNAAPKTAQSGVIGLMVYNFIYNSIIKIWEIICVLVYLCARKHKAAHSRVIGPVMGRRNRARRSYMRLLISNSLIIDFIIIITLLLASSSLIADYEDIKKHLAAFKYQLSMLNCVCMWRFILIFSSGVSAPKAWSQMLREPPNVPT